MSAWLHNVYSKAAECYTRLEDVGLGNILTSVVSESG